MTEDFIRVWPNFVPPEVCDETIKSFEEILADPIKGKTVKNNISQFHNSNLGRKDLSIFLEDPSYEKLKLVNLYLNFLQDCVTEYVEEFGQIAGIALSNYANIKVQRTMPMGGYHQWHYENGDGPSSYPRELVWMIYLNDMPDGEAETEFLFQCRRIKPTQGTVVIWPAGMTHTHRGLTVYTQPKYIATGWYYKTNTKD
jgi:hypothetical protein